LILSSNHLYLVVNIVEKGVFAKREPIQRTLKTTLDKRYFNYTCKYKLLYNAINSLNEKHPTSFVLKEIRQPFHFYVKDACSEVLFWERKCWWLFQLWGTHVNQGSSPSSTIGPL